MAGGASSFTGDVAFSGGGRAGLGGLAALYLNPAGAMLPMGREILAGFSPAQTTTGTLAYGERAGFYTSYGLGLFRGQGDGALRQGLAGGFTLSPGTFFSFGLGVFAAQQEVPGKDRLGVDFNVGAQNQMAKAVRLGACVRNINESGAGRREYGAGLLLFPEARLNLLYDGFLTGALDTVPEQVIGVRLRFGRRADMALIGSCRAGGWIPATQATLGGGLAIETGIGGHRVGLQYSLAGLDFSGTAAGLEQNFSLRLQLGLNADPAPPRVAAAEARGWFSPSGGDSVAQASFQLSARDAEGGIEMWEFIICPADGAMRPLDPVRHFTGRGVPPKLLRWDGRDGAGTLLAPGLFLYRFLAWDAAANMARTEWSLIELRN